MLGELRPNKKYSDPNTAPKVWSNTASWDSENYINFLKMVIKKEKESLKIKDPFYGGKRKKWIQDNAPCHCSLDTRYFIKKSHNICTGYRFAVCPPGGANLMTKYNPNSKLKPYPPNSPDFNPCEYLFIIYQLRNEVYYNYKRSKDYI